MARKKRKKTSSAPVVVQDKGTEGLEFLRSGRFKQAIESLKQALKLKPDSPELKETLAEAYVARAMELSEKGMEKEAVVMLEQSGTVTGKPPDPMILFSLFLNIGRIDKALAGLGALKGNEAELGHGPLGEVLAGLAVVGHEGVLSLFPTEAPFVQHHHNAKAALLAYAEGDDELALGLLKKLPIGSAFKHFRLFIHALILWSSQPQVALGILEKVGVDSPFHPLAQAVKLAITKDDVLLKGLSSWTPPAQELVIRLLGLSGEAMRAMDQLQSLVAHPDRLAKALLNPNLESHFPAETLKSLSIGLLPHAIGQLSGFNKRFGPLPNWEGHRVQALTMERLERWPRAEDEWIKALESIKDPLMKALVYRHLADLPQNGEDNPWLGRRFKRSVSHSKINYLELSLQHDPKDRDTHLSLVRLHGESRDAKGVRTAVDRALQEYPLDREILEAAMDAAFAAKTYKKAVLFAERILASNPIHQRAQRVMVESHLAHARKKVGERRMDLARKELLLAETMEKENARTGLVQICQGWVEILDGHEAMGEKKLHMARDLRPSSLEIELMILAEAQRMKAPDPLVKKFSKNFRELAKKTLPEHLSFMRLVQTLDRYHRDGVFPVEQWLEILRPHMDKAAPLDLMLEERRTICNLLVEKRLFNPLDLFAKAGQIQWPTDHSFLYFHIFAHSKGEPFQAIKTNKEDMQHLSTAMNSMNSRMDARTMGNIEKFLRAAGPFLFDSPFNDIFPFDDDDYDDDDDDFPDDMEAELGSMFELLTSEIRQRVEDDHKLRQRIGDEKYIKKLVNELTRGFPLEKDILRELLADIVLTTPLPDDKGGGKRDGKPSAEDKAGRQLELEFDD